MITNDFAMKIIYSFRLIYNEYCGNDKYRFRYDKNKLYVFYCLQPLQMILLRRSWETNIFFWFKSMQCMVDNGLHWWILLVHCWLLFTASGSIQIMDRINRVQRNKCEEWSLHPTPRIIVIRNRNNVLFINIVVVLLKCRYELLSC